MCHMSKVEHEIMMVAEVARRCGVTPASVRSWERCGKLPATRTESGVRLFRREDVARLVAERKAKVTA